MANQNSAALDRSVFNRVSVYAILKAAGVKEDRDRPFTDAQFRGIIARISRAKKQELIEEARHQEELQR